MKLYDHQKNFLKKNPNKSALIHSCGLGKTRTACEWIKLDIQSALVICPKSLKTNWRRELDMWGSKADILTKEEFRKYYRQTPRYGQIIVDECHLGFLTPHFRSQMSKALKWYVNYHKIKRFLALTATPYSSSPWSIYNLCVLLGHKINWQNFNTAFFYQVRMGGRMISVPKKHKEKQLADIVKRVADVVDIKDVMDVPLQNHCEPEYFALTPEQEHIIEENYAEIPIVRFTKRHELEQGILKGDEFTPSQTFLCDKNDRIEQLCDQNPKIAIICRYNEQIDELARILARFTPYLLRGDTKDRDAVCRSAEAENRAVVIIQADCGLGFSLASFPLCVFASMSFSYVSKVQTEGRFLRMDKPSRTTFLYLLTEGDSMDKTIYDSMARKEDFSIALYSKRMVELNNE